MTKLLELCLAVALLVNCVSDAVSQQNQPWKTLRLSGATFREAPGRALFSPDGKLYVAYRVPGSAKTTSTLRVLVFEPIAGKQSNAHDYAVPSASLPRVATNFVLSQDGGTLAYAELHAPQVVVTIEAATLNPISTSDASLFGEQDFGPQVSALNSQSLLLSAGKLTRDGRVTTVHEVRKISLNPRDLRQVVSEKTIPLEQDGSELAYWRKRIHTQREVGQVVPVNDGVLGLTNLMGEGWIQLFNQAGKELATLHNPECGFVRASLSPDQQVGVAVCERTGLDEPHFGQTLRRDAVVFDVRTLKVITTIPMSRMSVKEHGPGRDDFWVATPSPTVWHGKDRVLVAVPDFPDLINLYSIPGPTPTTH